MIVQVDPFNLIVAFALFAAYLLATNLMEVISTRLRSISFIKAVHTIVFVPLSLLLFVFCFEVISGRITMLSWAAIGVFLAETIVLVMNGWRCPLTAIAERLGSEHGQVTDFFFPKWFADRVFLVYGVMFVLSFLALVGRLLV